MAPRAAAASLPATARPAQQHAARCVSPRMGLFGLGTPEIAVIAVIGLLVLFILICVFIVVYKYIQVRRAHRQTGKFLNIFWASKRLDEIYQAADDFERSPISKLFRAGYIELSKLKSRGAVSTYTTSKLPMTIDGNVFYNAPPGSAQAAAQGGAAAGKAAQPEPGFFQKYKWCVCGWGCVVWRGPASG